MAASVFALRRSVLGLIMIACLAGVSCSDRESPTAPGASSMGGKATISGTLLAEAAASAGGAVGVPQPLAGVTVSIASSGQTTLTDGAGNFTLAGVSPGAVGLDFRGAGIQASTTVTVLPGVIARITATLNRGRGTVSLSPRSDGVEGTVDTINVPGMSFVLKTPGGMITVQTDPGTVFRMRGSLVGFGDLKTGQKIEVEGSPVGGSLMAKKVNIEDIEPEDETRTPTVTGTPPTATSTRTPRPDDEDNRTKTPTVTGTPPTATPTRTPEPDDEDNRTKTPTVTGTPPTATPTRTPEPDDEDNRTKTPTVTGTPPTAAPTPTPRPDDGDGSVLASRVSIRGN